MNSPHLFLDNLTVLSPTGLPAPKPAAAAQEALLGVVEEDLPSSSELNALALPARCRVLQAGVHSIDRDQRTLWLKLPPDQDGANGRDAGEVDELQCAHTRRFKRN